MNINLRNGSTHLYLALFSNQFAHEVHFDKNMSIVLLLGRKLGSG